MINQSLMEMLLKIRDCPENPVLKIRPNFSYAVSPKKPGSSPRRYPPPPQYMMWWLKALLIYETGTVNDISFLCDDSVGTMMSPDMQPKREFSAKYQPENCKEVEMISYLMDCYDRAGLEERLAPKVGEVNSVQIISFECKSAIIIHACFAFQRRWASFCILKKNIFF